MPGEHLTSAEARDDLDGATAIYPPGTVIPMAAVTRRRVMAMALASAGSTGARTEGTTDQWSGRRLRGPELAP